MKIFFSVVVAVVFLGAGAFGQGRGAVSAQPRMLVMNGNPQHAKQTALAAEQNLFERSTNIVAQGERPLWEFMKPEFVSLGDVARELRKEHETARKSEKVWTNY